MVRQDALLRMRVLQRGANQELAKVSLVTRPQIGRSLELCLVSTGLRPPHTVYELQPILVTDFLNHTTPHDI